MAKRKEGAGKEESWAARVIGFTGGGRWLIYLSMALSALSSMCSFVPFIAVYLVVADVVAVYPDFAALDAARMASLGWIAVGGVASNIGLYLAALLCAHSAAFDAEYNLKLQIVEHLGRIPLGRLEELGTGRVGKVMDESVGAIEGFLAHSLPDMAAAFTAPVAIVVLLFVFDWRFGLAAVACVVAAFGVEAAGFSNKAITDKMRRHLVNQERMTNATVEYVRGMPVVKTFGQTAESFGRLSAAVRAYTDLALDVALFWQSLMPAFTAIINNAYLFVLPVGIALGAGLTGGAFRPFALDFIFYLLFVPSIAGALNKMMYISEDSMIISSHLSRIDEVLGIPALPAPEPGVARVPERFDVELDGVSFSYGEGAPLALDGVSLSVPAGTTCALGWPLRRGKVDRGEPRGALLGRLGGRRAHRRRRRARHRPGRAHGLREPRLPGRAPLPGEHAREHPHGSSRRHARGGRRGSARRAGRRLHPRAATGIRHRLRQRGRAPLRRRGAARLHRPRHSRRPAHRGARRGHGVLGSGERAPHPKSVRAPHGGHATVIMIAHRLSTVAGADQIVVIDGGRVAERGRHEDLLAARGAYSRMWERYTQASSRGASGRNPRTEGRWPRWLHRTGSRASSAH